jgi:hypothetical protein
MSIEERLLFFLRTFNLQQSLTLRIGIADITLSERPGGGRKYGRKSVDSLGRSKHRDWKSDKKSFNSSQTARKSILISSNDQRKRGNYDVKERVHHISSYGSEDTGRKYPNYKDYMLNLSTEIRMHL